MSVYFMKKEKSRISVICVYNNKDQFENQLCKSLKQQDIEYDLIAIDNTKHNFMSAAEALNYGSEKARGDILIYSHQDIYLKQNDALKKIAEAIAECENGSIIGTQGVRERSKIYYSNLSCADEDIYAIKNQYPEELINVSCVDEGFFGMKKETWRKLKFNETLCDNWHLYCVEMCLHTRKLGHRVYVFPLQLHHFSMGTISLEYMKNLKKLCSVYRKNFKYIWTTCYKVKTNCLYINCLFFIWCLNRKIRGRL